jgi:hypothetical protein
MQGITWYKIYKTDEFYKKDLHTELNKYQSKGKRDIEMESFLSKRHEVYRYMNRDQDRPITMV